MGCSSPCAAGCKTGSDCLCSAFERQLDEHGKDARPCHRRTCAVYQHRVPQADAAHRFSRPQKEREEFEQEPRLLYNYLRPFLVPSMGL